jgi:DNA-binding HxlR family transcriptional regulator
MRSYDEYCSVAKALDVVGDRWTLLIVRELLLRGACRYTDLRHGLPGIASNLLADRLRDLEAAGIVAKEAAPPPVATTLFRLTPRGEQLDPVIDSLMRWGLPLMAEQRDTDAVRGHWLTGALQTLAPNEPLSAEVDDDGALRVAVGTDATVSGPARSVMGLLVGALELDDARAAGVTVAGDVAAVKRVVPKDGWPPTP